MPPSQKMYKKSRFSSRTEAIQYTLHNLEKKIVRLYSTCNLNSTYLITFNTYVKGVPLTKKSDFKPFKGNFDISRQLLRLSRKIQFWISKSPFVLGF